MGAQYKCKCRSTFPVLAIRAILTDFFAIFLSIAVPVGCVSSHDSCDFAQGHLTYHPGYESDHRGLVDRSHGLGGRPCEESSRHGYGGGTGYGHLCEESGGQSYAPDRGQSRSARMLMEGFEPTIDIRIKFGTFPSSECICSPRSSRDHLYRCAYCASHGRLHPHHGDSHTQRRQICYDVSVSTYNSDGSPAHRGSRTDGSQRYEELGCRIGQGGHSCKLTISS